MAKAITISERDMRDFLEARGFRELTLSDGTRELVYGRIVDKDLCLRVYTSVVGTGEDAIRCVLFSRNHFAGDLAPPPGGWATPSTSTSPASSVRRGGLTPALPLPQWGIGGGGRPQAPKRGG